MPVVNNVAIFPFNGNEYPVLHPSNNSVCTVTALTPAVNNITLKNPFAVFVFYTDVLPDGSGVNTTTCIFHIMDCW